MIVIGIMGKVGSGKSICVRYIKEKYNAIIFSCDDIAKELIKSKEVDYKVYEPFEFFTDEHLQEYCRKTIHPIVFSRINENINNLYIQNCGNISDNKNINNFSEQIIIIECALPSKKFFEMCDKTIYIENTYEKKVEFLKRDRGYTDNQIALIYKSQKYYEEFYRQADYNIKNITTKEDLYVKIDEVINEICFIFKQQ